MSLLSLDVASSTGFCLWHDLGRDVPPRIEAGSWNCSVGRDFDEKSEILSDHLTALLRRCRADGNPVTVGGVEDVIRRLPMRKVQRDNGIFASTVEEVMTSNPNTMIILPGMVASACTILHQFKVEKPRCGRLIPPATWRKTVIGVSRAPKHIPSGKTAQWLKAEVRQEAELLGQKCGFVVRNNDASDAIGLALHLAVQCGSEFARRWVATRGRHMARAA